MIADATQKKQNVFAFGASHAGLITLELFYRTGGLVTINPIRAPGMMLDMTPITSTSKLERLEGYGRLILEGTALDEGDVLIIHSVSGRNAVAIDMAAAAKEKGAKVIVLTNLNTSRAVTSRHSSGKKLFDFADVLFKKQRDWGMSFQQQKVLMQYAALSGLSTEKAKACLKNDITAARILKDRQSGVSDLGIAGTPSFVVSSKKENEMVYGFRNFDDFKVIIESHLQENN